MERPKTSKKCSAQTQQGRRCKNAPKAGSDMCGLHRQRIKTAAFFEGGGEKTFDEALPHNPLLAFVPIYPALERAFLGRSPEGLGLLPLELLVQLFGLAGNLSLMLVDRACAFVFYSLLRDAISASLEAIPAGSGPSQTPLPGLKRGKSPGDVAQKKRNKRCVFCSCRYPFLFSLFSGPGRAGRSKVSLGLLRSGNTEAAERGLKSLSLSSRHRVLNGFRGHPATLVRHFGARPAPHPSVCLVVREAAVSAILQAAAEDLFECRFTLFKLCVERFRGTPHATVLAGLSLVFFWAAARVAGNENVDISEGSPADFDSWITQPENLPEAREALKSAEFVRDMPSMRKNLLGARVTFAPGSPVHEMRIPMKSQRKISRLPCSPELPVHWPSLVELVFGRLTQLRLTAFQ